MKRAHACRAVILLASWRHGGTASTLGVSEWNNIGFLGRTGREDEEGLLPLMLTSWSA